MSEPVTTANARRTPDFLLIVAVVAVLLVAGGAALAFLPRPVGNSAADSTPLTTPASSPSPSAATSQAVRLDASVLDCAAVPHLDALQIPLPRGATALPASAPVDVLTLSAGGRGLYWPEAQVAPGVEACSVHNWREGTDTVSILLVRHERTEDWAAINEFTDPVGYALRLLPVTGEGSDFVHETPFFWLRITLSAGTQEFIGLTGGWGDIRLGPHDRPVDTIILVRLTTTGSNEAGMARLTALVGDQLAKVKAQRP